MARKSINLNYFKQIFIVFTVFLLISCAGIKGIMAQTKQHISSWIEKDTLKENLSYTAYFKNNSNESINALHYKFHLWKNSSGGTSKIFQSGDFSINPEQKISLSTIELNQSQIVRIDMKLEIYHRDSLIIKDSFVMKP
jgi:uncharacterized protein YcfL